MWSPISPTHIERYKGNHSVREGAKLSEYSRGVFGNKRQRTNPKAELAICRCPMPKGAVDV